MNNRHVLSIIVVVTCFIFICKDTKAQNYDANFNKPISTQRGQFVYVELPPIKTGATSTNPETSDSWGDLYQWGRNTDGHEKRYSDTTLTKSSIAEVPHNKFIVDEQKSNDWLTDSEESLWQGQNGVNNPCPCGYRLPTQKEWRAVLNLGYEVKLNPSGYYYLSIDGGKLILPCAGLRSAYTGNFQHIGTRGYYWASDAINKGTSGCIDFNKEEFTTNISIFGFRCFGRSIRCVRSE